MNDHWNPPFPEGVPSGMESDGPNKVAGLESDILSPPSSSSSSSSSPALSPPSGGGFEAGTLPLGSEVESGVDGSKISSPSDSVANLPALPGTNMLGKQLQLPDSSSLRSDYTLTFLGAGSDFSGYTYSPPNTASTLPEEAEVTANLDGAANWSQDCQGRLIRMIYLGPRADTSLSYETFLIKVREGALDSLDVHEIQFQDFSIGPGCEVRIEDFSLYDQGIYLGLLLPAGTESRTFTIVNDSNKDKWEQAKQWLADVDAFHFVVGFGVELREPSLPPPQPSGV